MPVLAVALAFTLVALVLPAAAAEQATSSEAPPATAPPVTLAPGDPILEETPLLVEARKRPPKELWLEMTQIHDEMHAYAADADYAPLSELARRMQADMFGAFVQVFDPLVQPRRVGLKRAVLGCASLPTRVEQAVKVNWPTEIEGAMAFVDGCMKMLARFYPPDMTGLPDEFAAAQPASEAAPAPAEKPKSD